MTRSTGISINDMLLPSRLDWQVVAVEVERAAGERYTGGVSCPVHSLLCTVEGTDERVPLIAKVVEVKESINERRRAIKCRYKAILSSAVVTRAHEYCIQKLLMSSNVITHTSLSYHSLNYKILL